MFPVIRDEHLESANIVVSNPQWFSEHFLEYMKLQSPGLAEVVDIWIKETGREYGPFWHIGVVEFQQHVGWILGCLRAAYGKFPTVDRVWCEKYLKVFYDRKPEENHKKIHEIHDGLHAMHGVWMEAFCTKRAEDHFSETATAKILLLADMFLKAVEEEDRGTREQFAKEVNDRVAKLSQPIRDFIEGLDLSGLDKKNPNKQ